MGGSEETSGAIEDQTPQELYLQGDVSDVMAPSVVYGSVDLGADGAST